MKRDRSAKRRRSKLLTIALWFAAVPIVALCTTPLLARPSNGEVWYWLDLAANLSAQWALLGVALSIICLSLRRRSVALLCLLATLGPVWVLTSHRAVILPLGHADTSLTAAKRAMGVRGERLVRVLHFNMSAFQHNDDVLQDLEQWDADIVSVTEPSGPIWHNRARLFMPEQSPMPFGSDTAESDSTNTGPQSMPGMLGRTAFWADDERQMLMGSGFVASRWPMVAWDLSEFGPVSRRLIAGLVDSPHGPFVVIGAHPRSPRDQQRWSFGNQDVEVVAAAATKAREQGLPLVVLADLNSTPSGSRSRRLASVGLRRSKPLLSALGTWPSDGVPGAGGLVGRWPLAIAIDDALVSSEWSVRTWTRGDSRGSDHWPVVVDLALTRAPNPPLRSEPVDAPTSLAAPPQ